MRLNKLTQRTDNMKVEDKKVTAFLEELAELTNKHGIEIEGCGCCNSPWLTGENGHGDMLTFEDGEYTVHGAYVEF